MYPELSTTYIIPLHRPVIPKLDSLKICFATLALLNSRGRNVYSYSYKKECVDRVDRIEITDTCYLLQIIRA